jgi:hypothetical protein
MSAVVSQVNLQASQSSYAVPPINGVHFARIATKRKSLGYLILRGMHHVALVNNGRIGGIFYHVT